MSVRIKSLFLTIATLLSLSLCGQESIELNNWIYDENIKSVKLHLDGLPMSQPIVDFESSGRLILSFDDISDYEVEYFYTIVHCDADWNKSEIEPLQYLENYDEGEIDNYFFSGATEVPYTHYRLRLPNEEVDWRISGNYVLIVYYYDGSERIPVLTRRFMVNENLVGINSNFRFPTKTDQMKSHQEMAIEVNTYQMRMRAPETQLRLYVYQNGRWDISKTDQRYDRYIGNIYRYDLPGKYSFPAFKEFRHLNNRYINSPAGDLMSLDRNENGYFAVRYPETNRKYESYLTYFDLNGQYIIQNREAPIEQREIIEYNTVQQGDTALTQQVISTERFIRDSLCLQCEYVNVLFTIKVREKFKREVYLFGEFTGWRLDPTYRLSYDPDNKVYYGEVLLKQGYYDYFYALKNKDGSIDTRELEGSWHETENEYLILVYDKHPFNQYDRLIGARMVNSSQ